MEKIINEFGFETIYLPCDASELSITSQEVNRPGLLLAGNDKYFDPARVQYLGFSEFEFVKSFEKEKQLAEIMWALLSGWENMEDRPKNLANKEIRQKAGEYIKQIEVLDKKALATLIELSNLL